MHNHSKKIIIFLLFLSIGTGVLFLRESTTPVLTETQKNVMTEYFSTSIQNPKIYGILEIPTIGIKNPIYQKGESENNVNENIELIEETLSVSFDTSRVVLASHSGNGPHAYFQNLDHLTMGDTVLLYYQHETKQYQYFKKEIVSKNGTVYVSSYHFPTLILITCSKTDDTKQEVYYAKFIKNM